jgi:hypothetical protein
MATARNCQMDILPMIMILPRITQPSALLWQDGTKSIFLHASVISEYYNFKMFKKFTIRFNLNDSNILKYFIKIK